MKTFVRVRRRPILTLGGIAILLVFGVLSCARSHRSGNTAIPSSGAVPVNGVTVARHDVTVFVDAVGTVTSLNVAFIRARVDGELTRVDFKEGQQAVRGEVLALIDPRPYEAALAQAEAAVRKDEALAQDLALSQSRASRLAELGAGAHQSADTLQAQLAAARATVAADAASAANARLNLQFATLRAPIDGRIGLRQLDVGSIVHAADPTPLVTITQMRPISVLFSVPQGALFDIQANQAVAPLEVLARDNEGRDYDRGRLFAIDSAIDPTTGQVKLRANFPNDGMTLWPGELVSVRVRMHTLANALVVPDAAVLSGQTGAYVFRIVADSRVEVRPVTVGLSTDGQSVITSGLSFGDQVVLHGQSRLKQGSLVSLETDAPPAVVGPVG